MRDPAPLPSIPATCVLPSAGVRRPAMTFSIVDLPQPEGPTIETNSPSLTVRLTRSRARVAPNAMLSPETETLGGTDPLLVPQVLELIAEAHRLLGDSGRVGVLLDGHDGADDGNVEGGEELLSHSHRGVGILAQSLERLHQGAHESFPHLRVGGQPLVAGLERREGHELEELRSLSEPRIDEVPRQFELLHGDGGGRLTAHEAVDLPRLERCGGRADAADSDDGHILVGLEASVLEERAQGEIGAAARAGHAEPRSLEILDFLGSKILAHHHVERVAIFQGEEVLGAESFLREDERALYHGAAQVDGAAD